jgi:hypothetical protein
MIWWLGAAYCFSVVHTTWVVILLHQYDDAVMQQQLHGLYWRSSLVYTTTLAISTKSLEQAFIQKQHNAAIRSRSMQSCGQCTQ